MSKNETPGRKPKLKHRARRNTDRLCKQCRNRIVARRRRRENRTTFFSLPDAKAILQAQKVSADAYFARLHPGVEPDLRVVSGRELLDAYDEAESAHPIPRKGRYGDFWHYDIDEQWICCDAGGYYYDIDLGDFDAGMPLRLSEKVWFSEQAAGDLIYMLKRIFGWLTLSPNRMARRHRRVGLRQHGPGASATPAMTSAPEGLTPTT